MSVARDLDILARTVYGEARGEGRLAQRAVAAVILNRVKRGGWWGDTVAGVCLAAKQFSCWNEGDPNRTKLMEADFDDEAFQGCWLIALDATLDVTRDPTDGAMHYHALGISPSWAEGKTAFVDIGNQRFYRDID